MSTSHPYPDGIDEQNVRRVGPLGRHASPLSLGVFGLVVALALSGALGHERTWRSEGGGAVLEVHGPEITRNGEFFEVRIRVSSTTPIGELTIGIEDSLWEDITVNTLIPAATEETNGDGETRFAFGPLAPDTAFLFKVDAQVNPDIVAGNDGAITLYDGDDELAAVDVTITVLP